VVATITSGTSLPTWTSSPTMAATPANPAVRSTPAAGVAALPSGGECVNCAASAGAPVMASNGAMPGRAVVGGETPGYAVNGVATSGYAIIGGTIPIAEPAPVGVVRGRYAYQYPNAGMPMAGAPRPTGPGVPGGPAQPTMMAQRPARGSRNSKTSDSAVLPTAFSNDPYVPDQHNRPHILSHMLGLDAIGHRSRVERERRERENHASIRYQPANEPVTDLPSTMVYGK